MTDTDCLRRDIIRLLYKTNDNKVLLHLLVYLNVTDTLDSLLEPTKPN